MKIVVLIFTNIAHMQIVVERVLHIKQNKAEMYVVGQDGLVYLVIRGTQAHIQQAHIYYLVSGVILYIHHAVEVNQHFHVQIHHLVVQHIKIILVEQKGVESILIKYVQLQHVA